MKSKKNMANKVRDKKNLSIVNHGDTVVIRNKSMIAGTVVGAILLSFLIEVLFILREAWDVPAFWFIFIFIAVSTLFSFINRIFGKIVLDSLKMTMTVYNPFKAEYKFADINYVDKKESKPNNRIVTHSVLVYIGNGRRKVVITTTSKKQADMLVSLLRGMLDNAAMEYPEGNEEPFEFDKKENKLAPVADGCSRFFGKVGDFFKRCFAPKKEGKSDKK